jgi:uncharacterized surface protein with fasciclin (FAS1) repeats
MFEQFSSPLEVVPMHTRQIFRVAAAALAVGLASPTLTAAQNDGHASATAAQSKDIVAVAIENGSFTTLVSALKTAGLVETLQGKGPFTVFAPTDAAFAKLPPGALDALLADKAQLTKVLTYHVVPGSYPAAKLLQDGAGTLGTVNGQPLTVSIRDGKVYVDDAQVVMTDVMASNGIIHVIDAVILPKSTVGAAGH